MLLAAGGCSRAPESLRTSGDPSHVVAALFESSPDRPPEFSWTPRLVLYDNGSLILRRGDAGEHSPSSPTYWTAKLTIEEMTELAVRQTAVLQDPGYNADYELSTATDQSVTTLVFGNADGATAVSAYGLWADESSTSLDSAVSVAMPDSLVAYYQFLVEILRTSRSLSVWRPDGFVAVLEPAPGATHSEPWPAAWPGLKAARVLAGTARIAVVVPVSSRSQFWAAFPAGERTASVIIGRQHWSVDCFPHFLGDDQWPALLAGSVPQTLRTSGPMGPSSAQLPRAEMEHRKTKIDLVLPVGPIRPPAPESPAR